MPLQCHKGIDIEFWQGKRVLLTGDTGFKGSWLALWLHDMGAEVTGYALAPASAPNMFDQLQLSELIDSRRGDIRDLDAMKLLLRSRDFDVVFHLAAQSLVQESYCDPVQTYATNVMGTVNLLEALRETDVRAAVIVTSDKCYENRETMTAYQENDAMGGYDPYSSSKGCGELVTAAYRRSFFSTTDSTAIATARAGNVIGGGDYCANRLLPDCIRAFMRQEPVAIRCPDAVRPWQHVLEPLSGYMSLAQALYQHGDTFAGGWNFGPAESDVQTVREVTTLFAEYWGRGAEICLDPQVHPHEAKLLILNCDKAAKQLGWHPRTTLSTALQWSSQWYHRVADGANARECSRKQIQEFLHIG
ncbi:MAG: CDP-glucose 4,6-dehydratase [Phycisphaerae bacterium]|nr:CDP-glucose 4,6-dehydratase [Phycisphaerae bacterium]